MLGLFALTLCRQPYGGGMEWVRAYNVCNLSLLLAMKAMFIEPLFSCLGWAKNILSHTPLANQMAGCRYKLCLSCALKVSFQFPVSCCFCLWSLKVSRFICAQILVCFHVLLIALDQNNQNKLILKNISNRWTGFFGNVCYLDVKRSTFYYLKLVTFLLNLLTLILKPI